MAASNDQSLPEDFHPTLNTVAKYGILAESQEEIEHRLTEAVRDAAIQAGVRPMDAGPFTDWAGSVLTKCKRALNDELCKADHTGLKEQYGDLLTKGLTTDGIAAVSTVIIKVVSVISPIYAVSSVLIYLSVFLLKVGLNTWCRVQAVD